MLTVDWTVDFNIEGKGLFVVVHKPQCCSEKISENLFPRQQREEKFKTFRQLILQSF
jgi:hypothetical protein